MKKVFKPTIGKKIFLLTAILSLALIIVSVTVASAIFNIRTKKDAETLCRGSAESLGGYFSELEMVVQGNGKTDRFVVYYKNKLDEIYSVNREEIEKMSDMAICSDEDIVKRRTYFKDLTSSLFGGGGGLGLSYDIVSFRAAYSEVIEEMERMASVDGMYGCEMFFYDKENNRVVYMCDSTSETSWHYSYPCSSEDAPGAFINGVYASDDVSVVSADDTFAGYAPIKIDGKTVAYVAFFYSTDRIIDSERDFLWTLIGIMLSATAVILLVYLILADRWLVRNVTKLSLAARAFTSHMDEGEIKPVDAEIGTNDEIGDLSVDFFALQNKVIEYSDDIAKKRTEDERMRAELNIASKIQMQSLPDKPLVTDDVRISSFIKPAKEVGGDLFDYFITNAGKIFFVIADVSGKGVPAALFMMRGKEIIRSCAKAGMNAGRIAETANRELCKNNKEGLFITAFIGIYDGGEKKLTFARAGHEQPFLLRGGVAEKIGEESNFVLGAFDNIPFVEDSIEIKDGDKLLLYTDGLNEGINESNEEFGYDRIKEAIENPDGNVLASLYEKSLGFAGGAEQFDDITMILFECVKSKTFTLMPPKFEDIPSVTDEINAFVAGLDSDKIAELDVIIDEVMNNYVSYAYDGVKRPTLDIELRLDSGIAELTFTDNGVLFDPLGKEDPDIGSDLKDRPIGGMGIIIVKTIADKITYRVFEGKNRLTVTKDLNGT